MSAICRAQSIRSIAASECPTEINVDVEGVDCCDNELFPSFNSFFLLFLKNGGIGERNLRGGGGTQKASCLGPVLWYAAVHLNLCKARKWCAPKSAQMNWPNRL